ACLLAHLGATTNHMVIHKSYYIKTWTSIRNSSQFWEDYIQSRVIDLGWGGGGGVRVNLLEGIMEGTCIFAGVGSIFLMAGHNTDILPYFFIGMMFAFASLWNKDLFIWISLAGTLEGLTTHTVTKQVFNLKFLRGVLYGNIIKNDNSLGDHGIHKCLGFWVLQHDSTTFNNISTTFNNIKTIFFILSLQINKGATKAIIHAQI
ncbi:hypothetical protein ACJX0J_010012, partial [Zea mays]